MQRYFLDYTPTDALNDTIDITGENFHHMKRVMRMKEKDACILVFSDESSFLSRVTSIQEDSISLTCAEKINTAVELPIKVTIACGIPKGEKTEWITQKCAELGAYNIQFFPSDFSVAKWDVKKTKKKQERLQKIALEACEQSHRTHLTQVAIFQNPKEFNDTLSSYDHIIVAYEESAKDGEKSAFVRSLQQIKQNEHVLFIFGSEGGISKKEIAFYEQNQATFAGCGPRIMRCETAPLYALSSISFYTELLS